jgi:hypothetical protein
MNAEWCIHWIDKVPTVRERGRFATTGEVGELHWQDYYDLPQAVNDLAIMENTYPDRKPHLARVANMPWHP